MLLDLFLGTLIAAYSGEYQGQQPAGPGPLWYVLFPSLPAIGFLTITAVQTAIAFRHAPPATREDRDALSAILWVTARTMVKLAVALGILFPVLVIVLPVLPWPRARH